MREKAILVCALLMVLTAAGILVGFIRGYPAALVPAVGPGLAAETASMVLEPLPAIEPPSSTAELPEVLTGPEVEPPSSHGFKPTLTLINQSSAPALVRLKGPISMDVKIPADGRRTVTVAGGDCYIRIRFGTAATGYSYSEGDSFYVTETATEVSAIAITFNAAFGNYGTSSITAEEFWQ